MDDLNDIFSSFFGGGRSRQSRRNGPQRGNDRLTQVKISFMDAINGKTVTLGIDVEEACVDCHGTGAKSNDDVQTCTNCGGKGTIRTTRRSIFGMVESEDNCPYCGGTGKIIKNKCPSCGGKGYVRKHKEVPIKVPAGINNGQQLRVAGMGERGTNGGPNGDLYVEILIKGHDNFKRDGNDIHIEVPLDFVDAILGANIEIGRAHV